MCSYPNEDREDEVVAITDTQDEAELLWIDYVTAPESQQNAYYILEEE